MGYIKKDKNTLIESDIGIVDGDCQVCGKSKDECECIFEEDKK